MAKVSKKAFYIMAFPALILFFIFHTLPLIQGIFYSFTNWKGYGTFNLVGLKNYINLFKDGNIYAAYAFTIKFAILSTILVNIIGLGLAIALNANIKFKNFLRALYFIPNILSVLIVGFIFNYMFTYLVPNIAVKLGITSLSSSILGNPKLAWIGIVIVAVWQAVAFNTIIYISGLQTIDKTLYESASIDGANEWKKFTHITFPLIAPFFTINMVLSLKGFLNVFDHIMAMTGGGPGRSTESIALIIYRGGFQGGEFAYQSANAVVYFIIILIVSFVQIGILRKREVEM